MNKRYILQITNDDKKIIITPEEAQLIAQAPDDKSITLSRLGVVVQKRMVMIYPDNREFEDKSKQTSGVLHDGTKVKKHFGTWVDANNFVIDDNDKTQPVRLDPQYYPEVALDKVPTEWEWDNLFKHLSYKKRIKAICGNDINRLGEQKVEPIVKLLKKNKNVSSNV